MAASFCLDAFIFFDYLFCDKEGEPAEKILYFFGN
jgi:hypothetical protein